VSSGSFQTLISSVFGSKRTIAFWPPSVSQAAPSGPWMTPCGADFGPSFTSRDCPVFGSKMPIAPCFWAAYQILPSGAGATSCG
jgi:hypothetical protein